MRQPCRLIQPLHSQGRHQEGAADAHPKWHQEGAADADVERQAAAAFLFSPLNDRLGTAGEEEGTEQQTPLSNGTKQPQQPTPPLLWKLVPKSNSSQKTSRQLGGRCRLWSSSPRSTRSLPRNPQCPGLCPETSSLSCSSRLSSATASTSWPSPPQKTSSSKQSRGPHHRIPPSDDRLGAAGEEGGTGLKISNKLANVLCSSKVADQAVC